MRCGTKGKFWCFLYLFCSGTKLLKAQLISDTDGDIDRVTVHYTTGAIRKNFVGELDDTTILCLVYPVIEYAVRLGLFK